MSRKSKSQCVKCRRVGEKLFLKGERCDLPKCSFTRRSYPPGKKGARGSSRLSEYGIQLKEKQKLKSIYFIFEKQLRRYFSNAKKSENTGKELINMLELRVDNVIRKSGFAPSIKSSRQLVTHHKIKINNKIIKSPNIILKLNDEIKLSKTILSENTPNNPIPKWLKVNKNDQKVEIVSMPNYDERLSNIDEELVVELYSR